MQDNKYINNQEAREITDIIQSHKMSRLFRQWTEKGLLLKIEHESKNFRYTKYKLADIDELQA
ncbi:MAG: hypothetical protein U9P70_00405 [Patescibacteria group bacterium]|nr:hypothetical protein [Patescibacteria group bacterium]